MDYIRIKDKFIDETDAIESADKAIKDIFSQKLITIETIKSVISNIQSAENSNNIEVFDKIDQTIINSEKSILKIKDILNELVAIELNSKKTEKEWNSLTFDINSYGENLSKIMIANKNISTLKRNIDIYFKNIMDNQVDNLRKLMETSDKNIVFVYKNVRYLSHLRKMFLDKVKTSNIRNENLNKVADRLLKVKELENDLFEKIFGYFSNVIKLAETNPSHLVKLLRIVEEDEEFILSIKMQLESEINKKKINEQEYNRKLSLRETNVKNENLAMIKIRKSIDNRRDLARYVNNGLIQKNVDEKNEFNLRKESIILNAGEDKLDYLIIIDYILSYIHSNFEEEFKEKTSINLVLDTALEYTNELLKVHKFVVPCFPKKYEILELFKSVYLHEIRKNILPFIEEINSDPKKYSANTIVLVSWLDKFDTKLKSIGVEISYSELGGEIKFATNYYIEYISDILDEAMDKILIKNLKEKEEFKKQKMKFSDITSFYASDVFRNVFSIIEPLSGDIKGDTMLTLSSVVMMKLVEMERKNRENISKLNNPDDIIIACVYILDSDNCINELPNYKEKMKTLLDESLHNNMKDRFNHTKVEYGETIKFSINKVNELLLLDVELFYTSKMFTNNWNESLVLDSINYFRGFFKSFCKMFQNQNIMSMLIRGFIEKFIFIYIESIIHSVRSIYRKEKKSKDPFSIFTYKLKILKCLEEVETGVDRKISKDEENMGDKKENVYEQKDNKNNKYSFPVKTLEEQWKKPIFKIVKEMFEIDNKNFCYFLDSFKESSMNPFNNNFTLKLDFFVANYYNKIAVLNKILLCEENQLKSLVEGYFKECYIGDEAKPLLDALLFLRPLKVSDDLRKLCIKCLN